jgi:hypothetical protein
MTLERQATKIVNLIKLSVIELQTIKVVLVRNILFFEKMTLTHNKGSKR